MKNNSLKCPTKISGKWKIVFAQISTWNFFIFAQMSYAHWDFVRFIQDSGLFRAWWRTGFTVSVCIHDIIDGLFFLIFQIIVVACLRIYTKLFFVLWFILDFFCSQTFWSCYYSLSSDPCKHTLFLENDKIMTLTKITSITYEVKLVLE